MTAVDAIAPEEVLRGYLEAPPLVRAMRTSAGQLNAAGRDEASSSLAQVRAWILGTGMTRVLPHRAGPANLIDFGTSRVLIDCGVGTTMRLLEVDVDPASITHVVITHHHLDHTLELASILLAPWADRTRNAPPIVVGPPGTAEFVDRIMAAFDYDIRTRIPFGFTVESVAPRVIEVEDGLRLYQCGWSMQAFKVVHDPVDQAFGYRFDWDGGSVAFSGDTAPSPRLVEVCRDVDVLVHEALFPGFGFPIYHTTVDQVGEVATRSRAKRLVLTHLIPGHLEDDMWLGRVRSSYDGPVTVGADLLELL